MTWREGDRIKVRGRDWRLVQATDYSDCTALILEPPDHQTGATTLLTPFDRPSRAPRRRPRVVTQTRWRAHAAALLSRSYPYGGLRHVPSAIRLFPYQLEPALAIFRHAFSRVLVADDVGLGKTVEAGVIVKETVGRSASSRALVVAPASLKEQWREELSALFGITAVDANAEWLRKAERELPPDVNPWSVPGVYLASMDFVKRAEALSPLEHVRWDLLVVDEVHNATPATDRLVALDALASRSRTVVLLSATPHSGAQGQFDALCRIGAAGLDAPLLCFRRSRTEADLDTAPVRSKVIAVRLTEPEHRLHRLLDAYTGRLWSAARGRSDANPALLATLFRKRALSSSTSLAISLRRRLSGLESPESTEFQPWLPIDDTAEADSCPAAIFRGVGLPDRATERNFLEQTLNVATMAALAESKARLLLRLLSRIREPAIVFSEFRDTAELLFNLVRDAGHRAVLLHGSLTPEERLAAAAAFRQNAAVLLATDAASEGLNLHPRCRLVIHYELPWSPSRLHQRCGRVNRIGQARRVHEIALVAADTAEQLVIGPLLRRTATSGPFSRATFVKQLSETRMASQIFGSREDACTIASAEQPESDSGIVLLDLRAEAREEADRLAELRRLCTRTNPMLLAAAVPVARGTRRSSSPDSVIVVLVPVTIRETGGGVVEEGLIAVRIDCSGMRWRRQQNAFRWQLERALPALEHRLGREVRPLVEARLAAVTPLFEIAMAERHQRNRALAAVRSHARQLVQPSLFSRVPGRALSASLIDELPEEREAAPRPAPRLIGEHGGIEAVYCGWLP